PPSLLISTLFPYTTLFRSKHSKSSDSSNADRFSHRPLDFFIGLRCHLPCRLPQPVLEGSCLLHDSGRRGWRFVSRDSRIHRLRFADKPASEADRNPASDT